MKPSTTLTLLSQEPDLPFIFFSSDGNIARIVNGKAKATEKASIVTIGVQNSP